MLYLHLPQRDTLRKEVQRKLVHWNIPFASTQVKCEQKVCSSIVKSAQETLPKEDIKISDACLCSLARDFWQANADKPTMAKTSFVTRVRSVFLSHKRSYPRFSLP